MLCRSDIRRTQPISKLNNAALRELADRRTLVGGTPSYEEAQTEIGQRAVLPDWTEAAQLGYFKTRWAGKNGIARAIKIWTCF